VNTIVADESSAVREKDALRVPWRRLVGFGAVSAVFAVGYLLVVGIVTAVIPTAMFERMTPVTVSNVVFWIVPALLFGPLLGSCVVPVTAVACQVGERTVAGGVLSFLAVGCPLCNKLVVLALGASGALTYFEPLQPLLGLASVALLGYAVWQRFKWPIQRPRQAPSPN
jgi:hypothetical protein